MMGVARSISSKSCSLFSVGKTAGSKKSKVIAGGDRFVLIAVLVQLFHCQGSLRSLTVPKKILLWYYRLVSDPFFETRADLFPLTTTDPKLEIVTGMWLGNSF